MAGRFGFHSGIMRCQDAKVKGDLYVQDDIVFSDVSAGVLGVTGGIDMQTTVSAIGIDMGGTFSTSAINIDGTCATDAIKITGTVGTGLYINKTANNAPTIKAHCHLLAATTDAVANEFKGEFLSTASTMDGVASHFHMGASGTGILRSVLGVAYLDSGKTLTGTDYTANGWVNGGMFVADVAGTIAGNQNVIAGLYAGISSCNGGTLTACKYMTSLYATSNRLTTLSAGQSSLILATNPAGAGKKAVDYGLRMETGDLVTTGMSVSGATTTAVSLEGTATDGIAITGVCGDAIHISGSNTASGLHISGDQVDSILIDVDSATARGMAIVVDDGITCAVGIELARSGTTGICTTGIMIDTDGTTALWVGTGFTGTTGILIAGTASTAGIDITGNCTNGINIEAQTTSAITFGVSDGYIVDAAASMTYYGGNTTGDALVLYGSSADGQKITITGAGNIDCVTATYTITPAAAGSAIFKLASDANAYTEFTQADGAGLTINCTSDGTASVTFSDNVILSTGVISGIKDVVTMGIGRVTALNFPYNNVTQTEAAAAYCKVDNGGVFGNLAAANAGYAVPYQLFPDTEVENDAVYFGADSKFGAFYMDNGTPAVYSVAASHITWEYYNGATWSALTILWDQTDTTANNGLKPFQGDGYILFSAPTNWATTTIDTQLAYWIRARCNATVDITTIPINNSVEHKTVAFDAGTRIPYAGTVGRGRFQFQVASTGTNDTKVILYNGTSGAASVVKTVTKAKIDVVISDFALTAAANDVVGFFVTQVDGGGAEYAGGTCELEVTRTV